MKPSVLYKTSSVLLAFFGITHTIGMFRPREGAGANAVLDSMRTVQMSVMGFTRTFWDFYIGFGLTVSVFLLYSSVLAWQLGGLSAKSPAAARTLAWPFAACQVAVAVLCWTNFFTAPIVVATLIAVLLLAAAWLTGRKGAQE